jgi:hypothetical protein
MFLRVPELAKALEQLSEEKFPKIMADVNTDRKPWRSADRKSQRSWIHS